MSFMGGRAGVRREGGDARLYVRIESRVACVRGSALAPRWTLPLPKGESAAPPRSRPTFSPAGVSEQCHRLGRRVQHSDGRGPFERSHEFPAACGKRIR